MTSLLSPHPMLTPGPTKVYLAAGPTDLRAGFDRLGVLVQAVLDQSATSGHLFVFCNAQRSRIKILFGDGTGLWLLTNVWNAGASHGPLLPLLLILPLRVPESHRALLSGIDLAKTQKRDWWRRE